MTNYARMYRLGITPWERYGKFAAESIRALLDRESAEQTGPLRRALDLGCGRGQFTPELARRGWQAVGVDYVPAAIKAAKRTQTSGVSYRVGDVTNLSREELGTFDFFLDIGCFQGFHADQRASEGRAVSELSNRNATLLMLAFGRTRLRSIVGGVTEEDVEAAFPGWWLLSVDPAETTGLGWPMNRTSPQWYRLRQQ